MGVSPLEGPSKTPSSLDQWILSGDGPLEPGLSLVGLDGLTKAMIVREQSRRTRRPVAVVFNQSSEARQFIDHLNFFSGPELSHRIHYFPAMEFDFHRSLLPNPELICERNVSLFHALNDPQDRIFVFTLRSVLQKVKPDEEFLRVLQVLKKNEEVDREDLILSLYEAGYQRQPAAYDPGIFTVRGGVIDIYCPLYENPLRVEFFDDLIEEVRLFDPVSQRSVQSLDEAYVIPVGQTVLPHGEGFSEAAIKLKNRLDTLGVQKAHREELLTRIQDRQQFSELALLFPLLSNGSVCPLDYFSGETSVFWDGNEQTATQTTDSELPTLHHNHHLYENALTPIAELNDLFLTDAEIQKYLSRSSSLFFEAFESPNGDKQWTLKREDIHLHKENQTAKQKPAEVLQGYAARIKDWLERGYRTHVVCHTQTHSERVSRLLEPYEVAFDRMKEGTPAFPEVIHSSLNCVHLWQGYVNESRVYPDLKLVLLSEEELFGKKKRVSRSAAWTTDSSRMLSSFRDLNLMDFVVHKEQGIGRYLGLKSMDFQGVPNDYVVIEYRDGDKLYIPIYRLNVIQKYVGGEAASVTLDKLGGDRWNRAKGKARKAIQELAAEFLQIQAKRKLVPGHPFPPTGDDYTQFEMEFPFDETPDQMAAIDQVMEDLGKPHPMDRLVCGDVGYGKTEVAMRAAFRAVVGGKQVAVLVPTTVLAIQHFESFKKRFADTAAKVEMVSRLKTTSEIRQVLEKVKTGQIDILIGTHRLLSADVKFKDLGLLVVDEEHRFGVTHKERLKKMSQSVHCMAMTATPIPRTLNMAMTGIKEISVISTPPPDRLSVRTFVCRRSTDVIKEAIQTELNRGGQVFFVHNRIQSMDEVTLELMQLVPNARIVTAHGQMDPRILEKKMLTFYQGEAEILLTTAIIESGLDIPRANTMIIDRADHFGLAQLYQLRGRVGRSEKRAYCYLLAPPENLITADAKERLQVIQRYSDLGSGFHVASHDMELRGAGDLLGKEQSGHLSAIGVDMYFELLEDAIRELKGEALKNQVEPEINMKISAAFPEYYLPDISERVVLYRRLSGVDSEDEVAEIESEIRDRFGALPEEVTNLLGLMRIKLYLKKLHVTRMGCGPKRTSLLFAETTPVSPDQLVRLISSEPSRYALTPDHKFVYSSGDTAWQGQLKEVQRLAEALGVA